MGLDLNVHNSHKMIDGQFVSTKASQVVEAIRDIYGDEIEVGWVPPGKRNEGEAAYAIIHRPNNLQEMILFYVQNDEDFDERVLLRILANDQDRNGQVKYSELEAWELTQKAIARQKVLDELEMQTDIAAKALASPLHKYKVNENLVIKEGIPHNAAHLDEHNKVRKDAPKFDIKEMME